MGVQVTADTAMAARDQASTLANSVIGNLIAVRHFGSRICAFMSQTSKISSR